DGRVVSAMLDPKQRGRPAGAYAVLVVHDGKLWTVDVDAQSGIAGKPRVVADDDDDDDDAKSCRARTAATCGRPGRCRWSRTCSTRQHSSWSVSVGLRGRLVLEHGRFYRPPEAGPLISC